MNQETQIIMFLLLGLIVALPKRYVLTPFWLILLFIPAEQAIVISGLDFYVIQISAIIGVLRCFGRGEYRCIKLNIIDKTLLYWAFAGAMIYTMRWGGLGLVWKCGRLLELFGCYFLFRQYLASWDDVIRCIRTIGVLSLVLLPLVLYEYTTASNLFSYLGRSTTAIREGKLRCAASFSHPILFGSFGAAMIPALWGLYKLTKKPLFLVCLAACAFFVFACSSSGPLIAMLSCALFLSLFRYRMRGKKIFGFTCVTIFVLHMVMKAPVWFLIARISAIAGSTGWHRANLIDQFVNHFSEWVLLGAVSVEAWGVHKGDVTNQFILEGVRGGLLGLSLYVVLIYRSIKILGCLSLHDNLPVKYQWFLWGLCCTYLVNCLSFMSVSFFGQMAILEFCLFAIASLAEDVYQRSQRVSPE